jgi:chemotaxis protein methyltransferase CheR
MEITDQEFSLFQAWVYEAAGISLSKDKKPLVMGRLSRRVDHFRLPSFSDYYHLLKSGREQSELQTALDLLTTNETYFFREPKHFAFLAEKILPAHPRGKPFRVWSAACSSGEEPYSVAMLLAERLGDAPWSIVASDISTRVLAKAKTGHYSMERTSHIPPAYLSQFCLKGIGSQEGTLLIEDWLRERIQFMQVNLNTRLPNIGPFDLVLLRNVMIYFDNDTKRQVVDRIVSVLEPSGYFYVGHSENLNGISEGLKQVQPAIYRKA